MIGPDPASERTALITAVFERDSVRARQRGCTIVCRNETTTRDGMCCSCPADLCCAQATAFSTYIGDADTAVWETARQVARERAHDLIAAANDRRRATSESACTG